jgi:hypothetical protein
MDSSGEETSALAVLQGRKYENAIEYCRPVSYEPGGSRLSRPQDILGQAQAIRPVLRCIRSSPLVCGQMRTNFLRPLVECQSHLSKLVAPLPFASSLEPLILRRATSL